MHAWLWQAVQRCIDGAFLTESTPQSNSQSNLHSNVTSVVDASSLTERVRLVALCARVLGTHRAHSHPQSNSSGLQSNLFAPLSLLLRACDVWQRGGVSIKTALWIALTLVPLLLQEIGGGDGGDGGNEGEVDGAIKNGTIKNSSAAAVVEVGSGVWDGRVGEVVVAMLTSCFFTRDKDKNTDDDDNDNDDKNHDDDGDGVVGIADEVPRSSTLPSTSTSVLAICSWKSLRNHLLPPLRIFTPTLGNKFVLGVMNQLKDSLVLSEPSSSTHSTQPLIQPSSSMQPLTEPFTQPSSLSFQPRKWARHLCGLLTTMTPTTKVGMGVVSTVGVVSMGGSDTTERDERVGIMKAVGLTSAGNDYTMCVPLLLSHSKLCSIVTLPFSSMIYRLLENASGWG